MAKDLKQVPEEYLGFVAFTGVSFGAGGLLVKKFTNDGIDAFTVTWVPFLFRGESLH